MLKCNTANYYTLFLGVCFLQGAPASLWMSIADKATTHVWISDDLWMICWAAASCTLIVWLKMRADHKTPRLLVDKFFICANNWWIFFSFLLTSCSSVCDGDTQCRCLLLPIERLFHRDVWREAQFLKNVLKRTQIKQNKKQKTKKKRHLQHTWITFCIRKTVEAGFSSIESSLL